MKNVWISFYFHSCTGIIYTIQESDILLLILLLLPLKINSMGGGGDNKNGNDEWDIPLHKWNTHSPKYKELKWNTGRLNTVWNF